MLGLTVARSSQPRSLGYSAQDKSALQQLGGHLDAKSDHSFQTFSAMNCHAKQLN